MRRRLPAVLVILAAVPAVAGAITVPEIGLIGRCQKGIAGAGAQFAQRVIRATLKCTNAVAECQVQCEYGVFGPPCGDNPPPCCDSDDPGSNEAFGACMAAADALCVQQDEKMALYESQKQSKITSSCSALTQEQLCGTQGEGLNFATLNAGCQALDPNYTCNLTNMLACVGGPLQRQLTDRIGALLDPRAPQAVAALNLQSEFPGVPVARKVAEDLPAGKMDVWTFSGQAGDEVLARVKVRDDGSGTSALRPRVVLLGTDLATPVADTNAVYGPCNLPSTCGATCPSVRRTLPFTGTFAFGVIADPAGGCGGGGYRLLVTSPSGAVPVLLADDVDPTP